ncbi:MAG: alkaline phosphatase D family protein [Acidimicrobiia bacterium]
MLGAAAAAGVLAAAPRLGRPLLLPSGGGPKLASSPFALGVASGDPLPDGIVLWTRLVLDRLAPDGGMPPEPVPVHWELAADEGFRRKVRSGRVMARPEDAHAVHVDVSGLDAGSEWFYRFRVGDHESPIARTRTAPVSGAMPNKLGFAVASCQRYQSGFFTAHRHIAEEDVDAVLFLGDYIYESDSAGIRAHEGPEPTDVAGYRARYATYKSDPDLQAAHHAHPWIVTCDDHEVDNNYANDTPSGSPDVSAADFLARRAAAYRAWWEHQPVRIAPPTGSDLRIYRTVRYGRLAEVQVLDTRQYRTVPCDGTLGPRCDAALAPDATLLGSAQERWLLRGLRRSNARWNVLAQQVLMTEANFLRSSAEGLFSLDGWDGYPLARQRLLEGVVDADASNPVVVTGDIHSAWVNDLKTDFLDESAPAVGTELVGTSITSGFPIAELAATAIAGQPHLKYFEGARRGYARCTLNADEWRADQRYVSTIAAPEATVETGASFVIEAGRPGAQAA